MQKIKESILRRVAAASRFAAVKAAGSTSAAGCHQPKEPEAVRKLRKS